MNIGLTGVTLSDGVIVKLSSPYVTIYVHPSDVESVRDHLVDWIDSSKIIEMTSQLKTKRECKLYVTIFFHLC